MPEKSATPTVKSEVDYKLVEKTWGFERWIANYEDANYCGKELVCLYGKWSSEGKFHYHKVKDEVFYVVSGKLELELIPLGADFKPVNDPLHFLLMRGESIRVKPHMAHRFRSQTKMFTRLYEFSTHHEDEDSYYLEEK